MVLIGKLTFNGRWPVVLETAVWTSGSTSTILFSGSSQPEIARKLY